jgi:hypothetical protein
MFVNRNEAHRVGSELQGNWLATSRSGLGPARQRPALQLRAQHLEFIFPTTGVSEVERSIYAQVVRTFQAERCNTAADARAERVSAAVDRQRTL